MSLCWHDLPDGFLLCSPAGLHKVIRQLEQRSARHTSLEDNIKDTFRGLQLRSDPVINSFRRKPYCSKCKLFDLHHTVSCPSKVQPQTCSTEREARKSEYASAVESLFVEINWVCSCLSYLFDLVIVVWFYLLIYLYIGVHLQSLCMSLFPSCTTFGTIFRYLSSPLMPINFLLLTSLLAFMINSITFLMFVKWRKWTTVISIQISCSNVCLKSIFILILIHYRIEWMLIIFQLVSFLITFLLPIKSISPHSSNLNSNAHIGIQFILINVPFDVHD